MGDDNEAGPSRSGGNNPLYGAVPPVTQPSPSASVPASSGGTHGGGSSNPLFGAMPDPSPSSAGPSGPSQPTTSSVVSVPPPLPTRPSSSPRSTSPSSIPGFLRKITFIISLILGASSAVALVFSALVLPRLHASYSARKALVDQQSTRFSHLVEILRRMKAQRIYDSAGSHPEHEKDDVPVEKQPGGDEHRVAFEELSSNASASGDTHPSRPRGHDGGSLFPDTAPLQHALSSLASTRSITSTTRSSLLSTLESYTSSLHRALWSPKPGHGGYSVGLNSLNANLAKERHGAGLVGGAYGSGNGQGGMAELGITDRTDEYDAVRREIRGIKGMLLNRRNFTPIAAGTG